MHFKLTSNQNNFYIKTSKFNSIWNHGVVFFTDKKYSYEALNFTFNSIIYTFESLRLQFSNDENNLLCKTGDFTNFDYSYIYEESDDIILKKAQDFINETYGHENELFKCIIFNTPFKSGYIICAHHIIIDGFSTQIMSEYLNKHLKDNQYIPQNVQSYEDYIKNEEAYKISKRYQKDRRFWSEQFALNPQCTIFGEKKTSFDYTSDEVNFSVSSELFNKINAFCKTKNISVQSFFNTVYSTYIFRTMGTELFTVGVPVLNRTTEAEINTIGLYMHIVPLLVRLKDTTFLQNAVNIEDAQMNLFRHQKFTQHDIKELLKEKGRPQNSLFDIAADYQEFKANDDYEFEFIYSKSLSVPLEIHMQSFDSERHNLKIRYRTSMFTEKEIQTMMNSFVAIIEDALEHPDKKISELNMLSKEEKQKILYDFNDTTVEYNKDTCVYKLFEDNVNKNPERTAVVFKDTVLSYAELKNLVEYYSSKLTKFGIKQNDVVAIHLERSHKLVVFQLAVLKIGAIFLPLDKRYPEERIRYACKDCNAKILITDENVTAETIVMSVDDFKKIEASEKSETVVNKNSCYIIYTSGSTGKPKGCMLTGKGLLNFCVNNNTLEALKRVDNCVFACVNAASFDYFIAETLLPLTNGFTTVVLDDRENINQKLFVDCVKKNGINVLMTTPTRLKIYFGGKDNSEALKQLKCICTSGEPLTEDLLTTMYEKSPEAKVYNPIGPSECSVWDMGGELNREDGIDIHIGKPIANAQIYITDKYLNPVPIGVTGEICIAGDGVGAGYINKPELTAERFIDNPFGEGKLYKTGDLAYWREDGNIVFVGRNDFQVKIRGLRIELGEIENVISGVDGTDMAVAVVREDANGVQHICVFYTGKEKTSEEIKSAVREKLPSYMLPHIYVHLKEMPITTSGKIDRKALPEVSFIKESDIEKPLSSKERLVCDVFKKVLGLNEVGRNSDFFEIGGNSLSMISLLSEKGFENITAAEFMRNSVAKDLALLLNQECKNSFDYLEALHISEKEERILVLFPFGGGGAEAFGAFVNEIKCRYSNVSVYFIRYLHSEAECKKAAEEIKTHFSETEISFYSHCAGAAVAMSILKSLEKSAFSVKHYYAGGIVPSATKDGTNIWNKFPDFVIERAFRFNELSSEIKSDIVARFRKDTDFLNEVLFKFEDRISTPITVITGAKDLFTRYYRHLERYWEKYADNVTGIKTINTQSHYFQSDNAKELTDIIFA